MDTLPRRAARQGPRRPTVEHTASLLVRAAGVAANLGTVGRESAQTLCALRRRLEAGRLHLAVLGQFKRGKSTLLNAFLGEALLPMGVVPLTSVPTFLEHGVRRRARVSFLDGRETEEHANMSSAELAELLAAVVTESGNPRNRKGVSEVRVEVPVEALAGGVVMIDTPGIGSTLEHNTAATMQFLAQCDAALFLTAADPPITEAELSFLRAVQTHVPHLIFVLNKCDRLGADEREQALAFTRHVLAEDAGLQTRTEGVATPDGHPQRSCHPNAVDVTAAAADTDDADPVAPLFTVSALHGLRARQSRNEAAWRASGLEPLARYLVDTVASRKLALLAQAAAKHADRVLATAEMHAGLLLAGLKRPQQDLEERLQTLRCSLRAAERERTALQDSLEGDRKRLATEVEREAEGLRERATQHLSGVMARGLQAGGGGRAGLVAVEHAWSEAAPDYFASERPALEERMRRRLAGSLEPHRQRLEELVEAVRRAAAELFDVPYAPAPPEDPLELARRPYWVPRPWETEPLPRRRSLDQHLEMLVNRNVENLRWATLQNVDRSFRAVGRALATRLDAAAEATEGAIATGLAQRREHADQVAEEVRTLHCALSEIAALREELRARERPASVANA